jgi:hypothetical protein
LDAISQREFALMPDGLKVLTTTALAFAVVAVAVTYGRDTTIFVPPPEAVAEQFTRDVSAKRYDRALKYVASDSGITYVNVRLGGEELQRHAGAVASVEGEPGSIDGDRATGSAVLITERAGRMRYKFRFARRQGVWKIAEWSEGT